MAAAGPYGNYDKRLISILEILGAHFVGVYYNFVYDSARTHLKAGDSLTDEYVRRVRSVILGVKNDEQSYREVVHDLHTYFQSITRFTTLSFADFVEQIVSQFVPGEYYGHFNAPEKDEALGSIIVDLVSVLGAFTTTPDMLRRIIDGHDDRPQVTIRMLQDQAVAILLEKRGNLHNSFLQRVGEAKDTVSRDVVDGLKAVIQRLVRKCEKLGAKLAEGEEREAELGEEVATLTSTNAKLRKLAGLMRDEREQGLRAAAFRAAVPARDSLAEGAPPPGGDEFRVHPRDLLAEGAAPPGAADEFRAHPRDLLAEKAGPPPGRPLAAEPAPASLSGAAPEPAAPAAASFFAAAPAGASFFAPAARSAAGRAAAARAGTAAPPRRAAANIFAMAGGSASDSAPDSDDGPE